MTSSDLPAQRDSVSLHALLAGAVCLELWSGWLMGVPNVAGALLCHALAGLLVFAALGGLSFRAGPLPRPAAGAATLLCLGMPLFGLLGLWSVVLPAMRASGRAGAQPLRTLSLPSAPLARARRSGPLANTPAASRAHEPRMAEIGALRHMAPERALPLLRRGLTDPVEDVRLLAFAMLEQRERALRLRIDQAEQTLLSAQSMPGTPVACLREQLALAQALLELVQSGFVSGEAAEGVLQQARDHAREALAVGQGGHVGSAAVLMARLCLALRDSAEAERALEIAERVGVSDAEVAPLWAELFYGQRRFDRVRNALHALPASARRQAGLASLVSYWLERRPR